jgi:hypothetical protein
MVVTATANALLVKAKTFTAIEIKSFGIKGSISSRGNRGISNSLLFTISLTTTIAKSRRRGEQVHNVRVNVAILTSSFKCVVEAVKLSLHREANFPIGRQRTNLGNVRVTNALRE